MDAPIDHIKGSVFMVTANQLTPYKKAVDYEITESIKAELSTTKRNRHPFYLTSAEFDKVLRWKLRSQYGRQMELRKFNTEETIKALTSLAFSLTHSDPDYELELKLGILCLLKGVGVPVASAILALSYPEKYTVIDYRVWRQIFGENKGTFTISDYKKYLQRVTELAGELGWTVQEVDQAIWEYDRVNS